jgi:DNA-directed RNA polymerase subunit RPC12/RpoP
MYKVQKYKCLRLIYNHMCWQQITNKDVSSCWYFSDTSWENCSTAEDVLTNSAYAVQRFCMVNFDQGGQDVPYILNLPNNQRSCATVGGYRCSNCGKVYRWKNTLLRHLRLECGKEPQFHCPYCPYRAKRKGNLQKHVLLRHHKIEWSIYSYFIRFNFDVIIWAGASLNVALGVDETLPYIKTVHLSQNVVTKLWNLQTVLWWELWLVLQF